MEFHFIFLEPPALLHHCESHRLFGYIENRVENELPVDGERLNGFVCLVQALLLGSFAAILATHRSEILDQKITVPVPEEDDEAAYEAPKTTTIV